MMKNILWTLTICMVGLFVVIVLSGCKGPDGPAGADGKDASVGALEGFKEGIKCAECHDAATDTTYRMAARVLEWEESKHGSGTAWEENRASCAECHTSEGFIRKARGETIVADVVNATPPGCFACHSPHAVGDFSLRATSVDQQTLDPNITGVAASTFNVGNGKLCVACHRPRPNYVNPKPDPTKTATTDTIKIASTRWYAHYGVQGQILTGVGAFQWTDAAAYSSTTAHSQFAPISTEGCPTCHMADYRPANAYGGKIGGHTMGITYTAEGSTTVVEMLNGCKVCHGVTTSAITKLDHNSKITNFNKNMDTLKSLLVARNWIDTLNVIKASSSSNLKIVPASRSGALFNYMMLIHDGSHGIHNPAYANDMVRASIAELRK